MVLLLMAGIRRMDKRWVVLACGENQCTLFVPSSQYVLLRPKPNFLLSILFSSRFHPVRQITL